MHWTAQDNAGAKRAAALLGHPLREPLCVKSMGISEFSMERVNFDARRSALWETCWAPQREMSLMMALDMFLTNADPL